MREVLNVGCLEQLILIYKLPILGLVFTSILFLLLNLFFKKTHLITIFSATAVSCYYWFRFPALVGFGVYPGDGMLIDVSGVVPEWTITVIVLCLTVFFFTWIVFSKQNKNSWIIRPAYDPI